tara:strand:- start:5458 stop:5625 length:168 start_codon:yes stop_codon:yes gene_type:complete
MLPKIINITILAFLNYIEPKRGNYHIFAGIITSIFDPRSKSRKIHTFMDFNKINI